MIKDGDRREAGVDQERTNECMSERARPSPEAPGHSWVQR